MILKVTYDGSALLATPSAAAYHLILSALQPMRGQDKVKSLHDTHYTGSQVGLDCCCDTLTY